MIFVYLVLASFASIVFAEYVGQMCQWPSRGVRTLLVDSACYTAFLSIYYNWFNGESESRHSLLELVIEGAAFFLVGLLYRYVRNKIKQDKEGPTPPEVRRVRW